KVKGKPPFIISRTEAYIGVLIDDLVTKGTNEPYRMLTSRVEHRLILREDNADLRLSHKAFKIGLLPREKYEKVREKAEAIKKEIKKLGSIKIFPGVEINKKLAEFNSSPISSPCYLKDLLKRPEICYSHLKKLLPSFEEAEEKIARQVETEVKYEGYIQREKMEVERLKKMENLRIPTDFEFENIPGLSREVKEKLSRIRPTSIGQASRISGVTPAAIAILTVWLRKRMQNKKK
ncbi:tRNA uridine-5-carboxymethylaminomethyl(34) synthesis enzyme MnmG, partial [Candidatus Aerophobetes bacterium]|nr:tRNA uridine-5-carboxymethylaminomethyl(34) synthesis enzyme MnmG [Candidatus Aerophobetes bacterium]